MLLTTSIKREYRPNWAEWEGIRELAQNARDAQVEHGAPMLVRWEEDQREPEGGILRIENRGEACRLSRQALLLGETSKAGRTDLLGQWGDGLKIGVLALLRRGCRIGVKTGRDRWEALVQESKQYGGARVLAFKITEGRADFPGVQVTVRGVARGTWEEARRKLRWVSPEGTLLEPDVAAGRTGRAPGSREYPNPSGTLIFEGEGNLFARGIWVERQPTYAHGYDFTNVLLDVDRGTLKSWDRDGQMRNIWMEAADFWPEELGEAFFDGLLEEGPEFRDFRYNGLAGYKEAGRKLRQIWVDRYGEDAIPCTDEGDISQLAYLGARGIKVSREMCGALSGVEGMVTAQDKILALSEAVVREFKPEDLEPAEQDVLLWALALLDEAKVAGGDVLDRLRVCEFNDPKLMGLWKNGAIKIARKAISQGRIDFLRILVHELAHDTGSGHDKEHLDRVEHSWAAVVAVLSERKAT